MTVQVTSISCDSRAAVGEATAVGWRS